MYCTDQDEEEDTVDAEVFKKSYIPRVLDDVMNFEQDLSKVFYSVPLQGIYLDDVMNFEQDLSKVFYSVPLQGIYLDDVMNFEQDLSKVFYSVPLQGIYYRELEFPPKYNSPF